jgi:hypothetical protein
MLRQVKLLVCPRNAQFICRIKCASSPVSFFPNLVTFIQPLPSRVVIYETLVLLQNLRQSVSVSSNGEKNVDTIAQSDLLIRVKFSLLPRAVLFKRRYATRFRNHLFLCRIEFVVCGYVKKNIYKMYSKIRQISGNNVNKSKFYSGRN